MVDTRERAVVDLFRRAKLKRTLRLERMVSLSDDGRSWEVARRDGWVSAKLRTDAFFLLERESDLKKLAARLLSFLDFWGEGGGGGG